MTKPHLLVKFKTERNKYALMQFIKNNMGVDITTAYKRLSRTGAELLLLKSGTDPQQAARLLSRLPEIQYAQPDYDLFACGMPYPDKFGEQWGLKNVGQLDMFEGSGIPGVDINIEKAWEITKGSENVIVAVLDSGADVGHGALKPNLFGDINVFDEDSPSADSDYAYVSHWDFVGKAIPRPRMVSEIRHGTLVTGIIAASGEHGTMLGTAPNVKVVPLRFMQQNQGSTSSAIEAIEYAKAIGAKIINCSWGSYRDNPALTEHIKHSDILFVCAAGNGGNNLTERPFYPACLDLPNVLSTTAIDNTGFLWVMSNFGENIHLAAPGVSILSTVPTVTGSHYAIESGTSLSAPFVAGVAALIMSVEPDITPEEVKNRILKSVTKLPDLKGRIQTGGIVNAYEALRPSVKKVF